MRFKQGRRGGRVEKARGERPGGRADAEDGGAGEAERLCPSLQSGHFDGQRWRLTGVEEEEFP